MNPGVARRCTQRFAYDTMVSQDLPGKQSERETIKVPQQHGITKALHTKNLVADVCWH